MPTSEPASLTAGTVVVVPFPYMDKLAEKRRPAVVVSNAGVSSQGFVWLVMVTSIGRGDPQDVVALSDHAAVGLSHPSFIRPAKITCIEPSRIIRSIGTLPAADMAAVAAKLHSYIA
ncbi:MAG: type II toxin-antitoxin system PemK/MazF family toxin [Phreatobacter sp.]|nr:type II toxin-antitoxin system PemK/MazF family toxin [Phreatobacter sp.]